MNFEKNILNFLYQPNYFIDYDNNYNESKISHNKIEIIFTNIEYNKFYNILNLLKKIDLNLQRSEIILNLLKKIDLNPQCEEQIEEQNEQKSDEISYKKIKNINYLIDSTIQNYTNFQLIETYSKQNFYDATKGCKLVETEVIEKSKKPTILSSNCYIDYLKTSFLCKKDEKIIVKKEEYDFKKRQYGFNININYFLILEETFLKNKKNQYDMKIILDYNGININDLMILKNFMNFFHFKLYESILFDNIPFKNEYQLQLNYNLYENNIILNNIINIYLKKSLKPIDIQWTDFLINNIKNYHFSIKLDGINEFILIYNNVLYTITKYNQNFKQLIKNNKLPKTLYLFECETIKNHYYIYDCLNFNNRDITFDDYEERLKMINDFFEDYNDLFDEDKGIDNYYFHIKKTFDFKNNQIPIYNNKISYIKDVYENFKDLPNDGVIVTPDDGIYKNLYSFNYNNNNIDLRKKGTINNILKWKPVNQLTIDLYYQNNNLYVNDNNNKHINISNLLKNFKFILDNNNNNLLI